MAAVQAKIVALSGDGQPKAAVPTESSDQLFLNRLSARNCANNQERLFAGDDGFGQGRIRRLMGQIFLTGEEAQESATLLGDVIADRPLQHGIRSLDRVENGSLRHRTFHLNLDLVPDVGQRSKMLREFNANVYRHFNSTFTLHTSLACTDPSIHCPSESRRDESQTWLSAS